jgi:D-lactate dehydrogenase
VDVQAKIMKVAVFSTKSYDRAFLEAANAGRAHELVFFEPRLNLETSVLAAGFPAACIFVSDLLDAKTLKAISQQGIKLLALRSAGFNHVDLAAAADLDLTLLRVPAYSPYAVAEHAVAMILSLNRRIHRAYNRVREGNFALDGLLGFDLHGKTVGIVGTGKIGAITAKILQGFGCRLLGYDVFPSPDCKAMGMKYVSLPELFGTSDIVSLHCPMTAETYHLINAEAIDEMKPGIMLINTSRGQLIDTKAVTDGLKSGKIGYLGLDVYERETDLFFENLSNEVIQDDVFQRLLAFPNVLITGHQAFFTEEALQNIAETTIANITEFERGGPCQNQISFDRAHK